MQHRIYMRRCFSATIWSLQTAAVKHKAINNTINKTTNTIKHLTSIHTQQSETNQTGANTPNIQAFIEYFYCSTIYCFNIARTVIVSNLVYCFTVLMCYCFSGTRFYFRFSIYCFTIYCFLNLF